MKSFSKVARNLIGQPMFQLLNTAKVMENHGRKIIHFEIGDPNFDSPIQAKEEIKKAIDDNLTHYTDSMGLMEFRQEVCNYTEKYWKFRPSVDQVLECPANAIIDFTIRCVANPGEEIIYPDPSFSTYYSVINYNGMVPVPIQLKEKNDFRMEPDEITKNITDNTRLIILNNPNNPTGSVMNENEILEIAKIARDKDIYLLSDEVYAKIIYNGTHYSPAIIDKCKDRCIVLNSLSKTYSMSGWRLGYAVGPEELIKKMGLMLQTIMSCQPAFIQFGGKAVLHDDRGFLDNIINILKTRRDMLINGIKDIDDLKCKFPDGAFYVFINIKKTGIDSDTYANNLLQQTGVCVVPGNCFGKFGEGYVRLCYASTSLEDIKFALEKIKEFHKSLD